MRRIVLSLAASIVLAGTVPAAASAESFTYAAGELRIEGNTLVTYTFLNPTSVTQNVSVWVFLGTHTVEVPAGGAPTYSFTPCFGGPCSFPILFTAQSGQLFATLQFVPENAGTVYTDIPAGGFAVTGSRGRIDESVASLAGSDAVAFGSLQSAAAALGSQVGGGSAPVGSQLQALQGEVQGLKAQLSTLTSEVATLNRTLAGAGAHNAAKKKRRRKKH